MNNRTLWINLDGEGISWLPDETAAVPLLRKSFVFNKKPSLASLRFAAPGWAEITINGKNISKDVLVPIVTQLDKHTGLCEYDVTNLVEVGTNVIGCELGNGWYNVATKQNWNFNNATWRNYPRLFLELYIDGEKFLNTDKSWKGCHGPILSSQFRCGEVFDANRIIKNWDLPNFDDSNWKSVTIVAPPAGELLLETASQCQVINTLLVKKIT